ncbi:MAG: protein adenylyltransferase SelO family protein [Fibrobacterales bacterium]
MTNPQAPKSVGPVSTFNDIASLAHYSLMESLTRDPDATEDGKDHDPRQVFSGHYVPVKPTPIPDPEYIAHSTTFFSELGFSDTLVESPDFMRLFTGDNDHLPEPMHPYGWACGYALSIYGTEYTSQCPFRTGNGYGDGRAISILEGVFNGNRWEMQLKGGGRTPYCRGADGRAVLRSSIREFIAQEHMHALGIPTSRSLCLYVSKTEETQRPWYSEGSRSEDPDVMVAEPVAISTRVAPSFLRVGQLELFGRRARKNEHPQALEELEKIVLHTIDREYSHAIDNSLSTPDKVIALARTYQQRLTSLVTHWIRVGFCQGNFNSDNCAMGGFTLDYGPFGFIDLYDPEYQPWTGGGRHFSFMNQPVAAHANFTVLCSALKQLLTSHQDSLNELEKIQSTFPKVMNSALKKMWAEKLGFPSSINESALTQSTELYMELQTLMTQTPVDYTIFFRELSSLPDDITPLKKSFYDIQITLESAWTEWLNKWRTLLDETNQITSRSNEEISQHMKKVNPKYILREWFVVPAYQQAKEGDYSLVRELQELLNNPYGEQSDEIEQKYYRLKPRELFRMGGVSHLSCSS